MARVPPPKKPKVITSTPLVDEVTSIASRLMGKIESQIQNDLADNFSWGIIKTIYALYDIGNRFLLVEKDADFVRLRQLLEEHNEMLMKEIIENRDRLRARFSGNSIL